MTTSSTDRPRRKRHSRRHRGNRRAWIGLAAAVLLFAAVIVYVGPRGTRASATGAAIDTSAVDLISDSSSTPDHPVYLHSVIAGGAYNANELADAMLHDAVVEGHYRSLAPETVRAETVTENRLAYVSYRKNDRIYWTRNKVLLRKGETILTDGATEIRARCGNCISDTPRFPVADVEPDPLEFERLVDGPDPSHSNAPVAGLSAPAQSGRSTVTTAASGAPAGGTPSGSAASNGFSSNGFSSGGAGAIAPPGFSQVHSVASGPGDTISNAGSDIPLFVPAPGDPFPSPGPTAPAVPFPPDDPPAFDDPPREAGSDPGTFPPALIDTPPGLDDDFLPGGPDTPALPSDPDPPKFGSELPEEERAPDSTGDEDDPLEPSAPVSVPEPGMLFLLGGGTAVALFRKLRSRR